jgi:phytoene dehydrogenase-like protein
VADSDDEDDPEAAAAGDEDEDDVPSTSGRGSPQQQQLWGDGGAPPAWYTPDTAAAQLAALAPTVDKWMRLLAKLYVESDPEARGPLGDALGALARIAPPQLLLGLFKMAADKLARVMREAAAQPPPPDPLMEGGATAAERAATFLELMLALGPGLVEGALGTLAQVGGMGLNVRVAGGGPGMVAGARVNERQG